MARTRTSAASAASKRRKNASESSRNKLGSIVQHTNLGNLIRNFLHPRNKAILSRVNREEKNKFSRNFPFMSNPTYRSTSTTWIGPYGNTVFFNLSNGTNISQYTNNTFMISKNGKSAHARITNSGKFYLI